jgi:hypothetical protein
LVGVAGEAVNTLQTSEILPLLPLVWNMVLPFLLSPRVLCTPVPIGFEFELELNDFLRSGTSLSTSSAEDLAPIGEIGLVAGLDSLCFMLVSPNLGISVVMPAFFFTNPVDAKAAGEGLMSPNSAAGGV